MKNCRNEEIYAYKKIMCTLQEKGGNLKVILVTLQKSLYLLKDPLKL